MEIDHVLVAVADLEHAAERLERDHDLTSYAGGRHPGWGTANRIVPLETAYLELITVVDKNEARKSILGSWVGAVPDGTLIGWCVRPQNIDTEASRLNLSMSDGSRALPSGERIAWRTAGVEESRMRPWLPFFISREGQAPFPGAVGHPSARISRVDLEGDHSELAHWLGDHSLAIDVRPGTAGVTAIALDRRDGEIVVREIRSG